MNTFEDLHGGMIYTDEMRFDERHEAARIAGLFATRETLISDTSEIPTEMPVAA